MKISLICAVSRNGVIGKENRLPWRLLADLRRFKSLTMGHPVLMGRKTFESIGKPLPGRTNVVITRQKDFKAPDCLVAHSLEEALRLAQDRERISEQKEIFVIGGATLYKEALPKADKIYLTFIDHDFEGDTFLFEWDRKLWKETSRQDFPPDEETGYPYSFLIYEKI